MDIEQLKTNLPESVRKDGLFCLWRYEAQPGRDKPTKVPYRPRRPNTRASSTDPDTFAPFETALDAAAGFDGVGLGVFGELSAIDIDHCIQDGEPDKRAREIIEKMKSYTEVSPSGQGIRILFQVKPGFRYDKEAFYVNHNGLEIYAAGSTDKYVSVTGNAIRDTWPIAERTFEVLEVAQKYMKRPQTNTEERPAAPTGLSADEIIRKASRAQNGQKFMQLWSGDTSGYASESEADMALCSFLAFWTGRDPVRMDELFRQSGLMRDKWDSRRGGKTYGQITIEKAAAECKAVYSPEHREGLEPGDYTDLGQADVFIREYGNRIRFSKATDYLVYDGAVWRENRILAQGLAQELTRRQLEEARKRIRTARDALDRLVEAEEQDADAIREAGAAVKIQEKFRNFVLERRSSGRIKATLTEAAPGVLIDVKDLDADGYLLNTPAGTVDLRTGQMRPHNPADYCTKITGAAPGTGGADAWQSFLDALTVHDTELARYLQEIAGMCAIGHVKREELIIATGSGGNGKSTFFNLLARVLGDYSGGLSAEVLTTSSQKNKFPEYAELRGRRMVIAAELEEGTRLDTSVVKKLCSTDPITAEKKYKDPFSFIPSHHIVLYTNHLPKVGTTDSGTWDRLVVVPFNARFRGQSGEIKDYTSVLFDQCAGAVLSWIIQGAQRVIIQGFMIRRPTCVDSAINQYRFNNDWLRGFLDDMCVKERGAIARAGTLYSEYRAYCTRVGEYTRHNSDFSRALEDAGFTGYKTKTGKQYFGLRLKTISEQIQDGVIAVDG